jgi:two-component system, NtrC family, response regulator
MKETILIVDDEDELRKLLAKILKLEGFATLEAENGAKARDIFKKEEIALVITDVRLPDISGIELISEIKKVNPLTEILVITAYGTIEDGVTAIKEGAFDYLIKGDDDNKIVSLVQKAIDKLHLKKRIQQLEKNVYDRYSFDSITGNSKAIKKAKDLAEKISETDTAVLLLGETGTGKELFARSIHYSGLRKNKPFVAINCSAIPKDILESEMFGYKAGAFTGANKNKKGLFEEANLGTLFLDEIGELDLSLQAKFLRVLETNDFIKPGDTKPTQVDVRIITATSRNLEEEIKKGNFRSDLFYRISVMKIMLPSLKERAEDIPLLTEIFVDYFSKKLKKKIDKVPEEFFEKLGQYSFPGNIRELRNVIERAIILSEDGILNEKLLPQEFLSETGNKISDSLKLEDIEKHHIISVLGKTNGNKTKTAEILGIGLTTLYRKLQTYGIE